MIYNVATSKIDTKKNIYFYPFWLRTEFTPLTNGSFFLQRIFFWLSTFFPNQHRYAGQNKIGFLYQTKQKKNENLLCKMLTIIIKVSISGSIIITKKLRLKKHKTNLSKKVTCKKYFRWAFWIFQNIHEGHWGRSIIRDRRWEDINSVS